jgi:hypothetical protein
MYVYVYIIESVTQVPSTYKHARMHIRTNAQWRKFFPTFLLNWAEIGQSGQGLSSSDSLPSYKCANCWKIFAWLVIAIYIFQVLVHFHGSFPQFKVNFNYGTLLHVNSFDTLNKHTVTSTAIKWLLTLQRSAHCSGQYHVLFF